MARGLLAETAEMTFVQPNNTLLSRRVPRSEHVLASLESHKNVTSLIVGRGPFCGGRRPFVWAEGLPAGSDLLEATSNAHFDATAEPENRFDLRRPRLRWHNAAFALKQCNGVQPVKTPFGRGTMKKSTDH